MRLFPDLRGVVLSAIRLIDRSMPRSVEDERHGRVELLALRATSLAVLFPFAISGTAQSPVQQATRVAEVP